MESVGLWEIVFVFTAQADRMIVFFWGDLQEANVGSWHGSVEKHVKFDGSQLLSMHDNDI